MDDVRALESSVVPELDSENQISNLVFEQEEHIRVSGFLISISVRI